MRACVAQTAAVITYRSILVMEGSEGQTGRSSKPGLVGKRCFALKLGKPDCADKHRRTHNLLNRTAFRRTAWLVSAVLQPAGQFLGGGARGPPFDAVARKPRHGGARM